MRAPAILAQQLKASKSTAASRRKLGAFILGSTAACGIYVAEKHSSGEGLIRLREQLRLLKEGAGIYRQAATEAFFEHSKVKIPLDAPIPADEVALQARRSSNGESGISSGSPNSRPSGGASSAGISGGQGIGETVLSSDGIHMTARTKHDLEPQILPVTNYRWNSERPLEDLEAHIADLQKRRQQLTREAEFLWQWLSEVEAAYYNSPKVADTPQNENAQTKTILFLGFLGNLHLKSWQEVASIDWLITDSQKRVGQLRSAQASPDGRTTWQADCSDDSAKTKPTLAFNEARALADQRKVQRHQLEQLYSHYTMSMLEESVSGSEEPDIEGMYNPTTGKMETPREAAASIRKEVQKTLEGMDLEQGLIQRFFKESEERLEQDPRSKKE